MKKVILSLAVAGLFTASASAQAAATQTKPAGTEQQHPQRKQLSPQEQATFATKKLTTELGLSADQQSKVQAINETFYTKRAALKAGSDNGQEFQALGKERQQGIKAVLTPEQLQKYKELKQQGKRGGEHQGGMKQ